MAGHVLNSKTVEIDDVHLELLTLSQEIAVKSLADFCYMFERVKA